MRRVLLVTAMLACGACGASRVPAPMERASSSSTVDARPVPTRTAPASAPPSGPLLPIGRASAEPTAAAPPSATATLSLGPFSEVELPTTKIDLIALVDRALRTNSPALMGSVVIDSMTAVKRCQRDERTDLGARVDSGRREGAEAFATCVALVDWAKARRLGLDYGSGIGRPRKSCGFAKHDVAHLFYDVDGHHVRVSLKAFSYAGRFAVTLPLRCLANHEGWTVAAREESLAGTNGENRGRCPQLGWPIVRDGGHRCPAALRVTPPAPSRPPRF